jgi:hypothetical protein
MPEDDAEEVAALAPLEATSIQRGQAQLGGGSDFDVVVQTINIIWIIIAVIRTISGVSNLLDQHIVIQTINIIRIHDNLPNYKVDGLILLKLATVQKHIHAEDLYFKNL